MRVRRLERRDQEKPISLVRLIVVSLSRAFFGAKREVSLGTRVKRGSEEE